MYSMESCPNTEGPPHIFCHFFLMCCINTLSYWIQFLTDQFKWPLLGSAVTALERALTQHKDMKVSEVTQKPTKSKYLPLDQTLRAAHCN